MARPSHLVTLNLGSQTISVGDFRTQPGGGLVLRAFRRRDVLGENATDPARLAQVTHALREMLHELGIGATRVNYAVPAQSTFARFVKLPAVEEEKIERIIAFEAQQNVPFPINEVIWDYQLVGGGTDEQLQVVLVAIKSDLLESLNASVLAAGVRPAIIGVTTMALYNSFRYNYSDVGGCSLMVDIGARTTNLVFIEPEKIFSRSVPIGGSSITAAIAKEFNEPFALAENRKRDAGFVSLGGAYAEPDDAEVARMAKIIRSTMTRLHAEIMRSVSHYRSQQQGTSPSRIFLCGGSSSMPYVREFFQEKFQIPIEFFNPLRNVAVAPEANAEEIGRSAHFLGELVGLALRSVLSCPMELSLRPASVVRAQAAERRGPSLVGAVACVVAALLGWSAYYLVAGHNLRRATAEAETKVASLSAAQTQLDSLRKEVASLDAKAAPVTEAVAARSFWPQVLEDLASRLPKENIWLTELIPLSNGTPVTPDPVQLTAANAAEPNAPAPAARAGTRGRSINGLLMRGLYLWNPRQQEVVVDYFKNLTRSKYLAIDPNNQARVIKPTMPNNSEWAFPYELRVDLRQPLPLP